MNYISNITLQLALQRMSLSK